MQGLQDDISDIELKQRWRLYWIHCIFEFSHIGLQKSSWVEGSKAWESSFSECMGAYFDNLNLYAGYENALKSNNVSQKEANEVNTFHTLAYLYEAPNQEAQTILEDEEWLEVVEVAKVFWDYLKLHVTFTREIELIKSLEKEFC